MSAQQVFETKPHALDDKNFVKFTLKRIEELSDNVKQYTFALPNDHVLGLPTASLLMVRATSEHTGNQQVIRPYTPTSEKHRVGEFDLIVKKYPNGPVSTHMDNMKVGDALEMKGPFTKYMYKPNMRGEIGMIAGGTGITPMLQVIREIFDNPEDKTKVHLVFANTEEKDMITKNILDRYAKEYPDRVKVHYVLSKPPAGWQGDAGFISEAMLQKYLPKPEVDPMILVCGPDGLMKHISGTKTPEKKQGELSGLLKTLGYQQEQVFKY